MSNNVNALIANFPETLQQNALAQQQSQLAGQKSVQNMLALAQQGETRNALRNIYSDPRNIDPTTGLPNAQALPQLFQVNPSAGLDFAETIEKLNDSRSRAALTNLRTKEYFTGIYDQEVVGPLVERDRQLQANPGLTPEQRTQMLATYKDELERSSVQRRGIPDSVAQSWGNLQYSPTWAAQSSALQARKKQIDKAWEDKEDYDPQTGQMRKYSINPAYPSVLFELDHYTPMPPGFRPSGVGKPVKEPAEPMLNEPKLWRVPKADGSPGTEPKLLIAPKRVGDPWLNADQTPYTGPTANMSPVAAGDPDAPGAGMSSAALSYMAERERLDAHMTSPGWALGKYIPGMAEKDIRVSLGLPKDAPISDEDAQLAALNDVVTRAEIHSGRMALNVIGRQNALVQSFEGTALRNANTVEQLAPQGVGSASGMLWNRFQNATRREITGDPNLSKLDLAITDFKNEYVKIMSTSAGQGGMSSDEARREGNRLFNTNQSWPVIKDNLDVARQTMRNRVDSIHADWDATTAAIRGRGKFPEQLEPTPEEGRVPSAARAAGPVPVGHASLDAAQRAIPQGDTRWYPIQTGQGKAEWWRRVGGKYESGGTGEKPVPGGQ